MKSLSIPTHLAASLVLTAAASAGNSTKTQTPKNGIVVFAIVLPGCPPGGKRVGAAMCAFQRLEVFS